MLTTERFQCVVECVGMSGGVATLTIVKEAFFFSRHNPCTCYDNAFM